VAASIHNQKGIFAVSWVDVPRQINEYLRPILQQSNSIAQWQ